MDNLPTVEQSMSPTNLITLPFTIAKYIVNFVTFMEAAIVGILTYFILYWFWVWILDVYGWIEMDWLWDVIAPDHGPTNTIADKWVQMNTWWLAYATQAILMARNEPQLDGNNFMQMNELVFIAYPLLTTNMAAAVTLSQNLWLPQLIYFVLFKDAFVDEYGHPREGWPQLVARTVPMLRMLLFDFDTFLRDPEGRNAELNEMSFILLFVYTAIYSILETAMSTFGFDVYWGGCALFVGYYVYIHQSS